MKFPYDLRELVRLFEKSQAPSDAIQKNAIQIAKQKRMKPDKQPELFAALEQLDTPEAMQRLADEMMIAQTIGEALHLSGAITRNKEGGES